ncbi:MAG TPA: hypothetical protein V6D14_08015 [Coleofasciculaceae cyanobacterium]
MVWRSLISNLAFTTAIAYTQALIDKSGDRTKLKMCDRLSP